MRRPVLPPAPVAASSVLALLMVLVVAGCAPPAQNAIVQSTDQHGYLAGTALTDPYELPDQTLTDDSGSPYNLRTSPSKPVTLLFFGYTNCPDVCVAVLAEMATALQRSEPECATRSRSSSSPPTPPGTPRPRSAAYLDRFDPSFVGLTGDLSTIKQVARRWAWTSRA